SISRWLRGGAARRGIRGPLQAACFVSGLLLLSLFSAFAQAQTEDAAAFSQFRPRREIPGVGFIGAEVCAACHTGKAHSQTSMARALSVAAESPVLRSHPRMSFRAGPYSYEIASDGEQSLYRVTDGKDTISEPIAYVFGHGNIAQTYVLRHNGKLYEGRVSYYTGIDGLDWTIGDALEPSPSLQEAFGRDISGDEARNCFSCHGTAAVVDDKLELGRLVPGVGCEACHGPGAQHIAAMASGKKGGRYIFNPRALDADTLSQEFCGACHRGADTVGMMPDLGGINNVRFQPYRISLSRGHNSNDRHFACTTCHDPHVELNHAPAGYDARCTECHARGVPRPVPSATQETAPRRQTTAPAAKPCPVASEGCVTCHMPKVELPSAHFKFTDHRIRIARPGQPYPY
ncbi:MAG TPA: multiheme c-type cytochrome, partial [Terriglobales bacterium]|nr:multiheme c-type cytochrome [Terriglobales bacterium]